MFNHPIGSGGKPKPKSAPMPEPMEGAAMDGESQAPEQVAEVHGPAHMVNIEHDHEMGAHHVHSMHQDGHEHHSDHGSAGEAHEHAKKLAMAGGESESKEPEEDWEQ